MNPWLTQHTRAFSGASARLAGGGSLLNVFVIGLALALPLGFYVAIDNLRVAFGQSNGSEPQLSLFLALDASRDDVAAIEKRLGKHAGIESFHFVGREQALRELKEASGLADVVDNLPRNPLPDAFVVNARDEAPAALEKLRDELAQWPHIAHVQLDTAWAKRLDALLKLGRFAALLLSLLLAAALVAIVFNTIRLQILTQRDEITVAKLIGATDAFVRRPFLYFGALLGGGGGAAAVLLTVAGVTLLNRQLGELSLAFTTLFRLSTPTPAEGIAVLILAAILGWLGAWLAVSRNLSMLESNSK
jgi:cell division transport system permease protein